MSIAPQLTPDQDHIVSAFIALGYQIHLHRHDRVRPMQDLQAAIDWVRRVMKSNPEMQELADFIEKKCSAQPQGEKP